MRPELKTSELLLWTQAVLAVLPGAPSGLPGNGGSAGAAAEVADRVVVEYRKRLAEGIPPGPKRR